METVNVNLSDSILAQVELPELPQFLKVLNLDNLIVWSVEYLQLFKRAVLEAIEVLQLITWHIKELQIWHTVKTAFKVSVLDSGLDEKRLNLILS